VPEPEKSEDVIGSEAAQLRSLVNRVAAIAAAQDQVRVDVEKVRGSMQMVLISQLYVIGAIAVVYYLIRPLAGQGGAK
jgi:hypothetical protein